MFLKDVENCFF